MIPVTVTFLAILALIALAGAIVLVAFPKRLIVSQIGPVAANLAWAVAAVSTLGSLFLSEVADFIPCLLCWVQRGFMYPSLALTFPGPAEPGDLVLALAGALVSSYHYPSSTPQRLRLLLGTIPSALWVESGFVTFPLWRLCGSLHRRPLSDLQAGAGG